MRLEAMKSYGTAAVLVIVTTLASLGSAQSANSGDSQWNAVQDALGRPGKQQPDGAFKFSMPRKDLKVEVSGTPIKPGLGGVWRYAHPRYGDGRPGVARE